jgi:hypothetical protein
MRHLPVAIFYATSVVNPQSSGRRRRRSPRPVWLAIVAVLALIIAIAAPASHAARKPPVAHFKVSLTATEDLTWTEDTLARACGGKATVAVKGKGRSRIRVRTIAPRPAKAIWMGTKRRAVYFEVGLPVTGTYSRTGKVQRSLAGGTDCTSREWEPKPARDCGTRRYPRTAMVVAVWATPDHFPPSAVAPLVPSMYVMGPWVPDERWVPFRNCPSRDLNGQLGVTEPNEPGSDTGAAAFSIRDLFHGPKHITLRGAISTRVDLLRGSLGEFFLSGSIPVTVRIRWTMRLTRLEHPPAGPSGRAG